MGINMTFRKWISENRETIDATIKACCPNCTRFNDEERRSWVLNDEGLYLFARKDGVKI